VKSFDFLRRRIAWMMSSQIQCNRRVLIIFDVIPADCLVSSWTTDKHFDFRIHTGIPTIRSSDLDSRDRQCVSLHDA
jgi:hypothetical protein